MYAVDGDDGSIVVDYFTFRQSERSQFSMKLDGTLRQPPLGMPLADTVVDAIDIVVHPHPRMARDIFKYILAEHSRDIIHRVVKAAPKVTNNHWYLIAV